MKFILSSCKMTTALFLLSLICYNDYQKTDKLEFDEVSKMDISFTSGKDKFNYRVCAMIISGEKILAMHDDRSP